MRKYRIYIIICFILIIIFTGLIYIRILKTTIDVNDNHNIWLYIEKNNNISQKLLDIKEIKRDGNLFYVYFLANNKSNLLILKQNIILKNRYSFYAASSSSNSMDMFSCTTSKETLIVAYGNNSFIKADKYVINTNKSHIKLCENISNNSYILSIYKLSPDIEPSSNLILFDKNNKMIIE